MTLTDLMLVVLLPVLAVVSAFCSASETALFSLTHSDRLRLRRTAPGTERVVAGLLARPRRLLLAVLLLTNVANVTYFVVSAVLERRIESHALSIGVNIAALLVLILIADLLPKLLARRQRVRAARILARPLLACVAVASPVVGFLERWVILPMVRLVRPSSGARGSLDPEELAAALALAGESGEIRDDEEQLLGDVVDLGQERVRDVMTPRVSVQWIDSTGGSAAAMEVVARARRERLPVFAGSMDNPPQGWLDVRTYLRLAMVAGNDARKAEAALRAATRAAVIVPERARLDRAFEILREKGETGALAVDEFGAFVGILAMSDVVRRLSAPVRRAALLVPGASGERAVVRASDRSWSVSGRLPLSVLGEFLGGSVGSHGDGSASTIAGLMMQRLGRLPRAGDVVVLGELDAIVREVSGRAVARVELTLRTPGAGVAR